MGLLKQLGQLLWKNVILRRREPHVLLLEIIWPLIIFGIVALVRHGTPGDKKGTCSYPDRALPSAGMMPFIQTTVCSLQNPCEEEVIMQQRQASASKLTSMVADLQPYLTAETSVQALQSLESSVKLVKGLNVLLNPTNSSDGTALPGLLTVLGNDTFTVRKLLKDATKLKHVLVDELKIMSPEVADAFLNASVDVFQVFQSVGSIQLRYIVCTTEELKKYMIFADSANISQISHELCSIDDDKIPAITDTVLSQIDVGAIIRIAKTLAAFTQTYELRDALEDIASMVDILSGMSSIGDLLDTTMLQSMLHKLPEYVDLFTQMQSFESSSVDGLLMFLNPIIEYFSPNSTDWQTVMYLADQLKSVADSIGPDGNLNLTNVLNTGLGELSSILDMFSNDTDLQTVQQLSTYSGNISAATQAIVEGQPVEELYLDQALNAIQMAMEQIGGKDSIDQMLCTADSVMDMLTTMVEYAEGIKKETDVLLRIFVVALDNLKLDIGDTANIAKTLFTPQLLTDAIQNPHNYSALCEWTLNQTASIDPENIEKAMIICDSSFLPNLYRNLSDAINVTSIEKGMADAFMKLERSLVGYNCTEGARLTMADLYPVALNLTTRLSALGTPSHLWEVYDLKLNQNITDEEWMRMNDVLGEAVLNMTWDPMLTMIGPMLEMTPLWPMMSPMFYSVYTQMNSMTQQMQFIEEMMDPSTDTGKLMRYVIDYMPEIMTTMMNANASQMLTEVMSSPDPIMTMCDQKTLQNMGMPDNVPVVDMEMALCNINWTEMVTAMSSAFDMQQVIMYFEPNATVAVPDQFDWDGMVSNMHQMMKIYNGENPVMDLIMMINFTRMEEAMTTMMSSMTGMTGIMAIDPSSMDMSWEDLVSVITGMGNMTSGIQQMDMINMLLNMMSQGNDTDNMMNMILNMISEGNVTGMLQQQMDMMNMLLNMMSQGNSTDDMMNMILNMISEGKVTGMLQQQMNMMNMLLNMMSQGNGTDGMMNMILNMISQGNVTGMLQQQMNMMNMLLNMMSQGNGTEDMMNMILNMISEGNVTGMLQQQMNMMNMLLNMMSQGNSTDDMMNMILNMISQRNAAGMLQQQMNMFNMLLTMLPGNATDIAELQSMQAVFTYQMHTALQFIIKHLTYFNNTGSVNLRTYLGSTEFNKILDIMVNGPDISAIMLETMTAAMADTDMVNFLMSHLDQVCTNRSVFVKIFKIPMGSSIELDQLQSTLCGFDVNITLMLEEFIQNVDGLSDVLAVFMSTSPPVGLETVNFTAIMAEQELVSSLIESLAMHPPTFTLGGSGDWMNLTLYMGQLEKFMTDLSTAFTINNLPQIQEQGFDSAFSSLQSIPEMESMLQMISFYVRTTKERFTQSIAASEDPLASLEGFPTLQKLLKLADDIPHLYAVLVFNSIYHSGQINNFLTMGSWEDFCMMTDLPVNVPGSMFNMKDFHTVLCSLNLTALEIEAAAYQAVSYGLLNYTTNFTDSVVNITHLSADITEMLDLLMTIENSTTEEEMVLPAFLNGTVWEQVNTHLMAVITDPDRLMNLTAYITQSSQEIFSSMMAADPAFREPIRIQFIVNGILGVFMDKLDNLSNKTVLSFDEILANDPETLKLWNILKTPGVLEVLMFSGNSPKFTELLMMDNMTVVFITLCDPATNLSSFLTIPSGVQIDLRQLQTNFCDVKFDQLEQEFMEEIMAVINKYMDNSTELDWSTQNALSARLLSWIEYWTVHTPILDLPSLTSLQTTLEQQYGQQLMEISWASMFGQTIGDMTDPNLEKALATVNLMLKVVNNRLEYMTDSVNLQTLLKNDTDVEEVIQAYLNLMQYSTDLLSPNSDINVERLLQLIENGSVLMSMCQSSTLASYLSKSGQATNLTNNIQIVMCMNPEVFMQNLQSQAEADYIEAELMRIWNSSEPLNMNWDDLNGNIENMTRLLTVLLQQEPEVDMGLLNLFGNFSIMMESFDDLLQDPMKLITMSSSVNPLMSTPLDPELAPFLDVWNQIYSSMHQMISSVQDGKPVNSSLVQNLFNVVMSLDIESLVGGADYRLLLEEVGQHTDVQAFLCDEAAISGYMLGAVAIKEALCGYPSNMWFDRLEQVFGSNSPVMSQLIDVLKALFPQYFTQSPTLMTWGELMDQMQNLTETTLSLNTTHTEMMMQAILEALGEMALSGGAMSDQPVTSSSMEWLKMVTNGTSLTSAQGLLTFLTEVNNYLQRQLQLLNDDGSNIPLTILLPNSTLLADLLEQLNHETAAGLLTAYINPNEFLGLVLTDRWKEVVCNATLFHQAFVFPNGTNTQKIQQDLCADAQSQESVITDILQKLNVADVLTAFDDWLMGRSPTATMNETSLQLAIQHHVEMLINNIEKITNRTISINGLDQWLMPIMKALEAMNSPKPESIGQTCEMMLTYVDNTDFYTSSIQPILQGILNNMAITTKQMAIQSIIEDSLCDLANWNVSALTQRIKETNLTQLIISLGSPVMDVSGTFQCSAMVAASNDLAMMWNESVARMTGSNTSYECLLGSLQAPLKLFSDATQTFALVSDLLSLLSDPAVLSLDENLMSLMQFMYRVFLQQQSVSVKFVDILTSEASFEEALTSVLQISPQVMGQLLNSTLNADGLALLNQSAEDIAKTLCDPDKLAQVITLPQFANITMKELSDTLCGPNVTTTAEVFKSMFDISTISILLSDGVTDLNQWSLLSAHITDVFNNIQQLTTLPDITINLSNLNTLLPYLQRFIYNYGPEALADSLNVLLEDFKSLSNDTMDIQLLADMQHVVKGLTSLKVIRNFIPLNVVLQDVIKNKTSFRNYMINDLGLSPEVTEAVLTGAIDYTVLLRYSYTEFEEQVCDPTLLSRVLNLTTSSVNVSQISHALCNLNDAQTVNLTESLLQNLDVGELIKEYVLSGVDGILEAVNVTAAEVTDSLTKLSAAEEDLTAAATIYKNGSNDLNLNVFSSPEALTGSNLPSVSSVLCGESSGSLSFSDSIGISNKVGSSDDLSEDQKKEKEELSVASGQSDTEGFCQDMYIQIMTSKYGPVIWSYLKPLMRGKILFSPNNPTTRQLAEMMYNSSFRVLEDVQYYGNLWAKGLTDINQIKSDPSLMSNFNSMTSNSLVQSALQSLTGMSTDDLLSGLGILDNFDQGDLTSMEYLSHLLINYTSCVEMDRFQAYDTEADVMKAAFDYGSTNNLLAVVVFDNLEENNRKKRATNSQLPKHVSYKIRMDVENVMNTVRIKERMWRPYPEDNMVFDMRYTRGFIQLQDIIDSAIIRMQTGQSSDDPIVHVKQFPAPCHINDIYMNTLSMYLLPIMMTLAWVAALAVATKNLVYDREFGQEEALKVMGLHGYLNWWMWFLSSIVIMSVTSLICIVVLKAGSLYIHTNFGILFLYFLIFCFSSLMLCYMVSALFTTPTLAVLTVLMVYCASYIPYIVLISMEVQMEFWQKILACLSSTTSFGFAAQYIARYEIQSLGMHWDLIYTSPMPGDDMSFAWCCLMMIIDGVIYLVIGWYLRTLRPGKHGVSQPWYFPVYPFYWGCRSSSPSNKYKTHQEEGLVQTMPSSMTVGMSVQGLTKNYGKTKAVKELTADFYEGQITVLLGHNGAAKTTTIKMMTGVLEPTHGEIYMYGRPINKSDKKIGICPQHNTLFHYMTVEEHMKFYGSVKSSLSSKDLKYEREQLLKQVDMWHVRGVRVSELSGGMQRRLCVALAFVGGSEIVILDEPTSGVDPTGRHSIWNLILHRKSGCTILLSTHHLDEADMIGDRIAVMDNGRLMCVGSPLFLKKQLGSGYHLKLTKLAECNVEHVLGCVKTYIPDAAVVEDIGSEMTIKLPMASENMERLYSCLHNLDQNKNVLNIGNYGIFDTTLEEVFLKICAVAEKNLPLTLEDVQKASDIELSNSQLRISKKKDWQTAPEEQFTPAPRKSRIRVSTGSQKLQQLGALFTKRFHHYRRNWRMFISVVLFPVLFVAAALGMTLIKPNEIESPSLLLTPALYGPNSYAFYSDSAETVQSRNIARHLWSKPGMSTTCMAGMNFGSQFVCEKAENMFSGSLTSQTVYDAAQCTCSDYSYTCNSHAHSITAPQIVTNTTDILQNIGTHDVTDYLLKTYETYKENRFGGFSFDTDSDGNMKATVWYNNKGHHALPGYRNALSNSILRSKITQGDPAEYGITTYNHPILLTKQQLNQDSLLQNAADIGIAMVFLLAFTAIPVGFVTYVVNEYTNKEKQLQYVSGVGNFLYWITSLLWDMVVFCFTVGLVVVVMAIFRQNSYWARENLAGVVVLLILYGWATIPWMYCTVKLYKDSTSAYMVLFCLNLFVGVLLVSLVFILNFFSSEEGIKNVYEAVRHIFLIFPPYTLCDGLIQLTSNQIQTEILARFGQDTYVSPFSYDMLAYNYIALAATGLFFFIVLFLTEIRCPSRARVKHGVDDEVEESNEVRIEKQRVLSHQARNDTLVVSNLSKAYKRGRKSFLAVNHLSFGVPKGECFGLLGANGAGKTTTFRMLTGDILPSEGSATINHKRVTRANPAIGQEAGYCPQGDALDGYLTGRELLHCHAKLRGLPAECRDSVVEDLVTRLDLDFVDRTVHTYSGGMKRKLSIAIALLGEPEVVFLDEPTTGMDPVAKRLVWNCLMTCVKNQQAVILTSHSMEECDALCTRLAIMVNGEFRCLGSPQNLKNKYGDGYTVTLFTNGLSTNMMALSAFSQSSFPGSIIRDQHHGILQLDIPRTNLSVADILERLEAAKETYSIVHYSVSQTTLDNVFMRFVREQNDGLSPEFTDYYSGSSDSDSVVTSEPFASPGFNNFAYSNSGFSGKSYGYFMQPQVYYRDRCQ